PHAGQTTSDTFTASTVSGTAPVATVLTPGSLHDALPIWTTSGDVTEAGGAANATAGVPTASGTLSDTDVDDAANTFQAVGVPAGIGRGHGWTTVTSSGRMRSTAGKKKAAVEALNVGQARA